MERLVIVANDQDVQWGRSLRLRITQIAQQITAQMLVSLIGERVLHYAETDDKDFVSELVLWGRAEQQYLAAWTSAAPRSDIVESVQCRLDQGLVAEIFSTASTRAQDEPILQASSFTDLGERRGRQVKSMRGLPISVFGQCIAVLTWVGYEAPASSTLDENSEVSRWALTFTRLSELKIMKLCLGMDTDV
jgi:hypothetical protein